MREHRRSAVRSGSGKFGIATRDVVHFAALSELLFDIRASGFEQAVETAQRSHVSLQERFGHETADDFGNFGR
jgi:hypothetical protein